MAGGTKGTGVNARRSKPPLVASRRPSGWIVAGVVVVLLFAAAVGYGVYRAQQPTDVAVPAGATATGVVVGAADAPVTVDLYLDFQCPACRAYEQAAGATIDQLVASGAAKVVYHPLAYLDRYSSTAYSSRSAAASACAAQAGVFPAYVTALYANQPPENSAGLPDEQLVALGQQVGAGDGFAACVADGRYAPWVAQVTDAASKANVTATPTVLVNGTEIERTPEALQQAVAAAR